jgi:hypothetical protein
MNDVVDDISILFGDIPKGQFRVICTDVTVNYHWVVDDYGTREAAYQIADDHNTQRVHSENLVYSVFDEQGCCVRGEHHVGNNIPK